MANQLKHYQLSNIKVHKSIIKAKSINTINGQNATVTLTIEL